MRTCHQQSLQCYYSERIFPVNSVHIYEKKTLEESDILKKVARRILHAGSVWSRKLYFVTGRND